MGPYDGAVDHRVLVVGVSREMMENPFPDAGFSPSAEAPMDVFPMAEMFRQVTPGNACPISEQHRFDEAAVVGCRDAHRSGPAGQQVLDVIPLIIAQGVALHRSASKADRL